jgi:hypothetical protein
LTGAVETLARDRRIVGIAAGGSYVSDTMDEFSDLDLVIAVEPERHDEVLAAAKAIAATLGRLLAAFTGDHVGEPRLLICLYDEPLLHVDLKFVALPDVARRVEDPVVLWQRARRLSIALEAGQARYPQPDAQWIEDRFWVWVHYGASKIARGEIFEAIDSLSFLRAAVLGPLALERAGARPSGVRKIEARAPEIARALASTIALPDRAACLAALRAAVELYRSLRGAGGALEIRGDAEDAALRYLAETSRSAEAERRPG